MAVQAMAQANTIVGTTRLVKFVAVFNGNVAIGSPTALYGAAGGAGAFGSTADVQAAVLRSDVYFADGSAVVKKLDCAAGVVSTFAATVGTVPSGCRLICNWRGRLVLARQDATPHLWYMSRLDDPADWGYADPDAASAVAGNSTRAGTIGDAITALMPAGDDVLYFGCDHSLWRMVGDPGDSGQLLPVSEQIGVVGPNAWCQDPAGAIYFVSPQGLYRLAGGGLKAVSDERVSDYFRDVDRAGQRIMLVWDRDHFGLWIFRQEASGASLHLFWDSRTNSFWPMRFDNSDMKPRAALSYDGDAPGDRLLCVGGASDKLYFLDESALTDAGTAIESFVFIGPVQPYGLWQEAVAMRLDATVGEYPGRPSLGLAVNWTLQAAEDPYAAVAAPVETATGAWPTAGAVGRQATDCLRMRGRTYVLKLASSAADKTWAYERAAMLCRPAGKVR